MNDINIEEYVKAVEHARETRGRVMNGIDIYLGEFVDKVDKLAGDEYEFEELYNRIHRVISNYADECVDAAWNSLCKATLDNSRREHGND